MESVENPRPTNPNDTDDGSDALPAYLREPLPADPSLREAKELEERYAELLAHFEMLEAYEKNLKANVDVEEQKLRQLTETLTSAQEANAARRSQIFVERNNILLLEEQIRSTTEQRVAAEEQNANDKAQLEDDEKRAKEQAAEIEAMVAKAEEIRTTSPWIQDLNAAEESLKQQRAELETLEAEKASWEARLEAAQTTIKLHEEFPGFDFFTETAQLVEKVVTLRHQIYDETSRANAALKVKEMEGISSQASQSPPSSPTRPPPNVEINESPNNTDDVESASSTALATPVTVSPSPSPSREEDEPAQPIETPLSKASKLPVRKTPSGLHQPPSPNCPVPRSVLKKTTQYPAPPLSTPQQLQKTKNAHVQDYLEEQEENVVGSADSRQPKPRVRIVVNEPEEVSEEAPPVQEEEDIGDAASQSDFEANSDEMPVGTATHGDEPEESNETVEENPSAFGHQTILQSPAQYEDEEEPMEAEQQEDEEEEERDEGMEDDGEEGYEETGSQNADLLSASLVVPEEEEDGTGEEGEQVVDVPPIPPPSSRFQAPIAPAARPMPIPSAPVAASAAKKPVAPIDPSTILNISVNSVDPGGDFLAMMQVANDNQPAIQVGGGMTPEHGDSATDFMALFGGPSGGGGGDALMEGVVSGADTGMGGVFDFGFGGSGFGMDMDNTAMNGAAGGASSGNDAAGGSFNFSFNFP